ncbi:MAG: hypothetical protein K0Q50_902 [Vampirovibrio sp.]|jgi:hypothetical protein|nr:hypothetical protein [Vampirovibrio sp.]
MTNQSPFSESHPSISHGFRRRLPQAALTALLTGSILLPPAMAQNMAPTPSQPMEMPSSSSTLKVQTGSQKVPAGTMLTVAFNTAMDSRLTNTGDPFNAYLSEDFTVSGAHGVRRVVLPAGTMVRGRVDAVKRPSLFSRGGAIFLNFDHVVLPSGELLPLTLNLSTENTNVNQKGALYTDPGIGKKIQRGAEEGRKAFENITEQGFETGKQIAGGLGSIVTVPASVVGGALVGAGLTTGKAAIAVVGRGDSAVIKPGDTITIDFGGSFNLPSE